MPITNEDIYKDRKKKEDFESFAKGVEKALKNKQLEEMLMRLFSQFISPNIISAGTWILMGLEGLKYDNLLIKSKLEEQMELLGDNIDWYNSFIRKYYKGLVAEKDEEAFEFMERPGNIPYFAITSHNLNRTKLRGEVEKELRSAFSSGINTGYDKNKKYE